MSITYLPHVARVRMKQGEMLRTVALEHKRGSVGGCSNGAKVEGSEAQPGEHFRDVTAKGEQRLRIQNKTKKQVQHRAALY